MRYVTSIEQIEIEKGRQEERQKLALKMLEEGAEIEFVIKVTGFSTAQIQQLRSQPQQ